jgi:hypothetical protein
VDRGSTSRAKELPPAAIANEAFTIAAVDLLDLTSPTATRSVTAIGADRYERTENRGQVLSMAVMVATGITADGSRESWVCDSEHETFRRASCSA